jgi:oligopeptide transport system permease protein
MASSIHGSNIDRDLLVGRSLWGDARRRLFRNRATMIALGIVCLITLCAIFAPLLTGYSFASQSLTARFQGPGPDHWLGTDHLGRDVFSRLLYGGRISMTIGIATQLIILLIGVPVGLIAGFSDRADKVLMRMVDVLYAFPDILLVTILMSYLRGVWGQGPESLPIAALKGLDATSGGLLGVFLALVLTRWLTVARLVRAEVLGLREREFIEAARAIGAGGSRIMRLHLLPNTIGVILVAATFDIPRAIILEAGLSFLGLGVQPPFPSWGVMIAEGITAMRSHPHLVVVPALAISLTVLSFNLIGDGLRDALDPRLRM